MTRSCVDTSEQHQVASQGSTFADQPGATLQAHLRLIANNGNVKHGKIFPFLWECFNVRFVFCDVNDLNKTGKDKMYRQTKKTKDLFRPL